jgi:hypothetical protein
MKTRHATYVERKIEACSRKYCCRGQAITVTYFECMCVCSISYPACKAHSPYCIFMWPVRLYQICPHYLTNGTGFWNKLLNIKCVFWFFLQLLSEIFLILSRIQREDITPNVHWSLRKVPVIFVRERERVCVCVCVCVCGWGGGGANCFGEI